MIALRSGLGLGFMFVVAAEFMGASEGLGYLLVDGQQMGKPDQILAAIIAFALLGKTRRQPARRRHQAARALAGHRAGDAVMLSLEHLSKTYADGTRALSDINLTVREGEIVALIGGSGCGKTTLLRLIAGLDRASAGRDPPRRRGARRARIRPSASCSRSRACCPGCRLPTTSPSASTD